jgi:hypothetical protein
VIFHEIKSEDINNCDLEALEKGFTKNSEIPKRLNWIEDDKNNF